jgi:hypothetical protein
MTSLVVITQMVSEESEFEVIYSVIYRLNFSKFEWGWFVTGGLALPEVCGRLLKNRK